MASAHDADALTTMLHDAFADAASRIDLAQLTDAIATRDQTAIEAALGITDGQVTHLTTQLSGDLLTALLGVVVASMTAFASANGSRVQLDQTTSAGIREELAVKVITPLSEMAATTALTLATDYTGLPALTAQTVISLFALSLAQAKSIQAFRTALSEAQRSPRATNISGDTVLGPAHALQVIQRFQIHLNIAQRSSLRSIITTGINDEVVSQAVSRQIRALVRYRMATIAREEAARASGSGEYRAFVQGRQNQSLPRTARRFWVTAGDERVRHSHNMIPSMNSGGVDIGEPFQTPLGPTLYPPLEVNCRCRVEVRTPTPMPTSA